MGKIENQTLICHVCGKDGLIEFPNYSALPRVTSDCQCWGDGGRIGVCSSCKCVQKIIDDDWRQQANLIYQQYEIYAQAGGAEQAVFDPATGHISRRSSQLLECLMRDIDLPATGAWLDIGCGNGALLSALSVFVPDWKLTGSEIGETNRDRIEAIPNVVQFHSDGLESIDDTFDVISMVHVLEHIENPIPFLLDLHKYLNLGGYLLIEVPYHVDNPFDLLIADHSTHFAPKELQAVLTNAGYEVCKSTTDCVKKEISVLARRSAQFDGVETANFDNDDIHGVMKLIQTRLEWLSTIREELSTFRENQEFGIFGTSIAACFADQSSGGRAAYFVDEDVSRIGRQNLGRDILAPLEVSSDSSVYMAAPHPLCQKIASRLNVSHQIYVCPQK